MKQKQEHAGRFSSAVNGVETHVQQERYTIWPKCANLAAPLTRIFFSWFQFEASSPCVRVQRRQHGLRPENSARAAHTLSTIPATIFSLGVGRKGVNSNVTYAAPDTRTHTGYT